MPGRWSLRVQPQRRQAEYLRVPLGGRHPGRELMCPVPERQRHATQRLGEGWRGLLSLLWRLSSAVRSHQHAGGWGVGRVTDAVGGALSGGAPRTKGEAVLGDERDG
jgi:hypothetical protein